jgi:hypothetical protein
VESIGIVESKKKTKEEKETSPTGLSSGGA